MNQVRISLIARLSPPVNSNQTVSASRLSPRFMEVSDRLGERQGQAIPRFP